ncbi:hypothetical protein QJS66_04195 [Kocuria rhizophila]|nr:hypothetical protein QJS66_04195 [Kocuria rhizophila]
MVEKLLEHLGGAEGTEEDLAETPGHPARARRRDGRGCRGAGEHRTST